MIQLHFYNIVVLCQYIFRCRSNKITFAQKNKYMRYSAAVFSEYTGLLIGNNLVQPLIIPAKYYQEYFLIAAWLRENDKIVIPAFW